MNKIELLAPAGNLEKAKTAILYGADAVYIGGKQFSLRSRASNFDLNQIEELISFAHARNAKVHVTVNMLPHEEDLEGLDDYLKALDDLGIDAIIAASPYVLKRAQELNCTFERHVSTQHSSINSASVKFWKGQGMDRVVLGRECTMEQIEAIAKKHILPVEVFIHGGMCVSYSGRCTLSNHMTNRDANRGGCAQSCRWKYELFQDGHNVTQERMFSMSSKDLRAMAQIPSFIEWGVTSLKIEWRMKSSYYLATVVSCYRRLIDAAYAGNLTEDLMEEIAKEFVKAENRPAGPGFLEGQPGADMQLYRDHAELVRQDFAALVLEEPDEKGFARLQVRNRFDVSGPMEIFGPHIKSTPIRFETVLNEQKEPVQVLTNPMTEVLAKWEGPCEAGAMIRRVLDNPAVLATQSGSDKIEV
jgi:putative protease